MARARQLDLFNKKQELSFGGVLHGVSKKTNPKAARPVSTKHAMHIVMRASSAKGALSLLKKANVTSVERIISTQAKRHGVKIYQCVNVGNHIHLKVRAGTRVGFRRFLRATPGLIARAVLQKERGKAAKKLSLPARAVSLGGREIARERERLLQAGLRTEEPKPPEKVNAKFWDYRPFTRIVSWGRDFENLKTYFSKNELEAVGFDRNLAGEQFRNST